MKGIKREEYRLIIVALKHYGRLLPGSPDTDTWKRMRQAAAAICELMDEVDEVEDLALQRHRASEHWHSECVKLKADLARASSQITHWRNNHDNVLAKLRLFTQREDLPVDRIPAYQHVLDLERQLAEAQAQMQNVNDCFDAAADEGLFERIAECGHSPGDGSLADLVQRRLLFAPKTEPHIALSAAIADAVELWRKALADMCEEFRGHDLPYGSAAYRNANALLNGHTGAKKG